jgi:HAD superfamily hydrolase (TIGR01509 family)
MTLRGVLFDMGGTLLTYHPPEASFDDGWQGMEDAGAASMRTFLIERGYTVPPVEVALAANMTIMDDRWRRIIQREPINPQLRPILTEVMIAWGLPAEVTQDDSLLDAAMAAYVAPIQANFVRPIAGAEETLAALHERGLRVGLISNTMWPGEFHMADLAKYGLDSYLECAVFSADAGVWKPDAAIFRRALDALDLQPSEAAYIGDSLYFDVHGAQGAGLKAVWVGGDDRRPHQLEVTPDATLTRLPELLEIITLWQ